MNNDIIGIDLGTTNSAVGVVDSGFPLLLADQEGHRIQPSVVAYMGDDVLTGRAAERCPAESRVRSVKRLLGRKRQDLTHWDRPLNYDANGFAMLQLSEKEVSPEEVSAEILKALKKIAEDRLERAVERAVITVPAYFNDAQRAATKRAGELAGLKVERILSEPTAAALAYGLSSMGDASKIAVYDLGGGTFDISVLEIKGGVFHVLATAGDTALGGDDMDELLAQRVLGKTQFDSLADLEISQSQRLMKACQQAKEQLSDFEEVDVKLPFFSGERHLECTLTRGEFNELIRPLLIKTEKLCRQVMLDADLETIDTVILVGGSTRIPALRAHVEAIFGKTPDTSQHPDEAVALGAVIQGGILSGAVQKMVLLDVTPLSLGVETFGGLMNVLIPRNTTIPCKAGEMFTNAETNQRKMALRVLQGEREMAKDNWQLGQFSVEFQSAPKGQARVGVQFSIDENGILEVLARDTVTGEDTVVEITSAAVDVTDDQVESMVSESVEYAFEDMSERVFTEARLKAEELLPAVEEALAQVGAELDADMLREISQAKREVEESLGRNDANALKAAVQVLDHSTEVMAAMLVEKAMEAITMETP